MRDAHACERGFSQEVILIDEGELKIHCSTCVGIRWDLGQCAWRVRKRAALMRRTDASLEHLRILVNDLIDTTLICVG